jgi:16S rRNA processing protein RimM
MTSSGRSETPPPTDALIVGEVVGPFGVGGEVKLYPLTDFPERLRRYRRLILALPDGSRPEVRVQRARPHKNVWLLKLRDVNTPEEAEALRGAQAMVPAHLAEPLPEGHFYLHDVIGLRAVTAAGEELGTVTDVLRSPANDVYVVGDLLIPAVKEIIERIDPAEGILVVRSKEALAAEEAQPERSELTRSGGRQGRVVGAGPRGDTERNRKTMTIRGRPPMDNPRRREGQGPDLGSS